MLFAVAGRLRRLGLGCCGLRGSHALKGIRHLGHSFLRCLSSHMCPHVGHCLRISPSERRRRPAEAARCKRRPRCSMVCSRCRSDAYDLIACAVRASCELRTSFHGDWLVTMIRGPRMMTVVPPAGPRNGRVLSGVLAGPPNTAIPIILLRFFHDLHLEPIARDSETAPLECRGSPCLGVRHVNVNTTDATAGATALLLPAQNTHNPT